MKMIPKRLLNVIFEIILTHLMVLSYLNIVVLLLASPKGHVLKSHCTLGVFVLRGCIESLKCTRKSGVRS